MPGVISSPSSFLTNIKPLLNCSNQHKKSIRKLIQSSSPVYLRSTHLRFQPVILGNGDRESRRRRWVKVKCNGGERERRAPEEVVVKEYKISEQYRYKVAALVAFAMCLVNATRVVMSVAVVPLAHQYDWSPSFVGVVQSSYLWGYIVSSVIGGAMADKFGGTRVMGCSAAFWSLATLLTPWAADLSTTSLLAVRVLFGLAQGVAFPSMSIILTRWFPIHERARAVGISMAGFQLGNVLGLCLTPILMSQNGISGPFVLFSSIGLLWLMTWVYGVTNDPRESSFISKPELQLIRAGKAESSDGSTRVPSIGLLLSKWPSWAVIFANIANNWGYFVLLSWMPIYFKTVLNVNLKEAAWFSAVPWGVMAVSSCVAGATSDYLIKADYGLIFVRKIMQSIGFLGPGLSLLCLNYAKTPAVASVILTMALSFSSFTQAGYLLNIQDIAPEAAGLLHGISNGAGALAAIVSTIGAGYFVEWLGSFKAFLTLTAMIYFAATIFFNMNAAGERVV